MHHHLLERIELLKAFIDCTSEGIIICDERGDLAYINDKAERFFGGPEGADNLHRWQNHYQVLDADTKRILGQEDIPLFRAFKGETFKNVEILVRRNDSMETLLFVCNGCPILDEAKNTIGAMVAFRDITARLMDKLGELNKALALSETRFRAIFEQSPLSIQLLAKNGRTLLVNPAFKTLWGFDDKFIQDFVLKEYNILEDKILEEHGGLDRIRQGFNGNISHIDQFLYDPKKLGMPGRPRWTEAIVYPLKDSSGEVQEVVIIHKDITDEHVSHSEKEELLSQLIFERNQFEAIIKQIPMGLMTIDANSGRIGLYNRELEESFGDIQLAFNFFSAQLSRTLAGESIQREEVTLKRNDGSSRSYLISASPIRDSDLNIAAGVLLTSENTDKKRDEQIQDFLMQVKSILISTINYNDVLDQIAYASIPFMGDGCIVDVIEGDTIKRIVTKHKDKSIEELFLKLGKEFPPRFQSPQPSARVIKSGLPELLRIVDQREIAVHTVNHEHAQLIERIGINSHIAIPLEIRGKIIGAINLMITSDRKKYDEKDLEVSIELARNIAIAIDNAKLFQDAQKAIRLRDEFISIASHELKNPITSLVLQADVLNDIAEDLDNQIPQTILLKKFLSGSTGQLTRLSRLVEDMLDISRISSGKLKLNLLEVNLEQLVKNTLDHFQRQLNNLNISHYFHSSGPTKLVCDPERIEQVIINFITNAIRYGEGKPIEVSLIESQNKVIIKIKDYGRGIHKNDHERIFNRFEQAHTADDVTGLGLGLFINKQIIEEHGGRILLESELGQGSTFIIELNRE